ncbi:tRNA methyltransferase 2 [Quaeritorhiza haematococci]|nr:tRNA methyltransferase 2 [Quaeritorhiza haematococci]
MVAADTSSNSNLKRAVHDIPHETMQDHNTNTASASSPTSASSRDQQPPLKKPRVEDYEHETSAIPSTSSVDEPATHADTPAESTTDAMDTTTTTETTASSSTNTAGSDVTYQLRLGNVPKFLSGSEVRKACFNAGLTDPKVKKAPKWDYAFLSFTKEEDKEDAKSKLAGLTIKNKTIEIREMRPQTNNRDRNQNNFQNRKRQEQSQEDDTRTPAEKLADQVTPLWRSPYASQLEQKEKEVKKVFKNLHRKLNEFVRKHDVEGKAKAALAWMNDARSEHNGDIAEVLPMRPSPLVDGYRNKCEFAFGRNLAGEKTVGFMLGMYKDGLTSVLEPTDCLNVSPMAKKIAQVMQRYIRQSDLDVYDRVTKEGFWRLMLVRTQHTGEVMIIVQVSPQGLDESRITAEKDALKSYLLKCAQEGEIALTTLLVQVSSEVFNGVTDRAPLALVHGPGTVTENLLGLNFRISPLAFFQVNTPATELLYSQIRDWCLAPPAPFAIAPAPTSTSDATTTTPATASSSDQEDDDLPIVLDLCCGTGTIGLAMAGKVHKVVGVEMIKEAVEDAKLNAEANGVSNVTYYAAKVEEVIKKALSEHVTGYGKPSSDTTSTTPAESETATPASTTDTEMKSSEQTTTATATTTAEGKTASESEEAGKKRPRRQVIAILDPPRSGVHTNVIKAIRNCPLITRVVYVSCDADAAGQNFVE